MKHPIIFNHINEILTKVLNIRKLFRKVKMDFFSKFNGTKGIRSLEVVPPKISKVNEQLEELRSISDLLDFITVQILLGENPP